MAIPWRMRHWIWGIWGIVPFLDRPRFLFRLPGVLRLCTLDHVGLDVFLGKKSLSTLQRQRRCLNMAQPSRRKDRPVPKNGMFVSRMAQIGGVPRLESCGPGTCDAFSGRGTTPCSCQVLRRTTGCRLCQKIHIPLFPVHHLTSA